MLTQSYLKSRLHYDKHTGHFTWITVGSYKKPGDIAGYLDSEGYRKIKVLGKGRKAHRLAWLYEYGEIPKGNIDHINRNKDDNSILNLRIANESENGQNRKLSKNNTTGETGVHFRKSTGKYESYITIKRVVMFLGVFITIKEAKEAYINAKLTLHPFNTLIIGDNR